MSSLSNLKQSMGVMDEYIEREALLNHVNDLPVWGVDGDMLDRQDVISSIENRPAADVAPVRHGKWEKYKATVNLGYLRCSVCEDVYIDEDWLEDGRWNYCPNCGAIMDGGENGD